LLQVIAVDDAVITKGIVERSDFGYDLNEGHFSDNSIVDEEFC
jgi:hypothetical protein